MEKETNVWETIYELTKIFIEIELEHHEKTWKWITKEGWKLIEWMDKKDLELYLHLNDKIQR